MVVHKDNNFNQSPHIHEVNLNKMIFAHKPQVSLHNSKTPIIKDANSMSIRSHRLLSGFLTTLKNPVACTMEIVHLQVKSTMRCSLIKRFGVCRSKQVFQFVGKLSVCNMFSTEKPSPHLWVVHKEPKLNQIPLIMSVDLKTMISRHRVQNTHNNRGRLFHVKFLQSRAAC